jgi:phasin family protein
MTTAKNPFLDFDMTKAFSGFAMPGFNVEAVMNYHRKNVEALMQANKLVFEGLQVFARRQTEIAREAFETAPAWFQEVSATGHAAAPHEKLAKTAEIGKASFEKGLTAARELGELVAKSNTEAFNVITKRLTDGFEEIRDVAGRKAA